MKKVLIFVLIISAFLPSCKKDDKPVFDKSADERLNETLAAYQAQLTGAQYGWKTIIKVDSGKGGTYSFYLKFNDANRVVMLSDFDSLSAITPKESSYRLKALQQPSLLFDTYSYLHVLSDPDETVNGGTRGAGFVSDFEFYFDSSASTDTIKLVGRLNGSKAVLVRATQQEATSYDNKELGRGLLFQNIAKYLNYFKTITIGGVVYEINVNQAKRTIIISWIDASGAFQTFTTYFYYSITGVQFYTALVSGNLTITGFTNLNWDAASITLSFSVNGTAATVTGAEKPLKADLGAPARWWNYAIDNGNTFWISLKGFHVNGVDDAFGVQSLTSGTSTYLYLAYWPKVTSTNDAFGPFFLNAGRDTLDTPYANAPAFPGFRTDGRVIFRNLGDYGPPDFLPYPATGPAADSKDLLYNSAGYYFVQTGETTYDMVSAVDSKIWISWEF